MLPGVAGRAVPEYLGRPAGDSVTAAAIQAGLEVTVVLPGCGGAVVATLAITADAGVIEMAGCQATVEWHTTQSWLVECDSALALAVVPLWQLWQLLVMPAWLKLAGRQATVE